MVSVKLLKYPRPFEEFFIVSPETEVEETLGIAERIRELVRGEAISDGKREVNITISAGVTMLKEHDRDIDVLFSRADSALCSAKQQLLVFQSFNERLPTQLCKGIEQRST